MVAFVICIFISITFCSCFTGCNNKETESSSEAKKYDVKISGIDDLSSEEWKIVYKLTEVFLDRFDDPTSVEVDGIGNYDTTNETFVVHITQREKRKRVYEAYFLCDFHPTSSVKDVQVVYQNNSLVGEHYYGDYYRGYKEELNISQLKINNELSKIWKQKGLK